jgi:hypothetical protein
MGHVLIAFDAPLFLFLVVLEFAVIHDAANGRVCRRSDLNKVQLVLAGKVKSPVNDDNAQLFRIGPYDADLARFDAFVNACELLDSSTSV